jgi:membrane protease YdiL (CAAX protease family)
VLSEKPWKLESLLRLFVGVLICLFIGVALVAFIRTFLEGDKDLSVWHTVAATLSFQGGTLVLVHLFLREHGMRWSDAFGFANQWQRAVLLGVLLAVLFLPVGFGLQWVSAQFMTRVDVEPVEQQAVQTLRITEGWLGRAMLAVVAIGLAPPAEEILFRGILYPAVKQAGFRRLALWGTSLLFAVIHANLATLLPLLVLSVALTLLYERTNNLVAPIVAHALFNAINFLRLYAGEWLSR